MGVAMILMFAIPPFDKGKCAQCLPAMLQYLVQYLLAHSMHLLSKKKISNIWGAVLGAMSEPNYIMSNKATSAFTKQVNVVRS